MLVASIFSSNWPASSPSAQPHGSVHARCRLCFDDILYSSHGQQNKHIRWCPIYVLCAPMCTTPVRSPSATLLISWWQWMVVVVAGREMYVTVLIIIFDPHQVQCCHPSLLLSMYCYYVRVLCFYQPALVPGKCHVRWKMPGAAKCFCATLNRFLSILNIFMNSKNMVSLLKFYFLVIPKYLIEFYPECFRVSAIISLGK